MIFVYIQQLIISNKQMKQLHHITGGPQSMECKVMAGTALQVTYRTWCLFSITCLFKHIKNSLSAQVAIVLCLSFTMFKLYSCDISSLPFGWSEFNANFSLCLFPDHPKGFQPDARPSLFEGVSQPHELFWHNSFRENYKYLLARYGWR